MTSKVAGNTSTPQAQGWRGNQVQEYNPHPAPQIQIGPGLCIITDIDAAATERVDIYQIDNGHHFCLPYHFKGV